MEFTLAHRRPLGHWVAVVLTWERKGVADGPGEATRFLPDPAVLVPSRTALVFIPNPVALRGRKEQLSI